MKRSLALFSTAVAALAFLASCGTSRLVAQQSNPDYVGKSFKSVMVVAATTDELVRRTFEDRMVALLDKQGVKGIPAYSVVEKRGEITEAELRGAIARAGAGGVLITRVRQVDRSSGTTNAATVTAGYGWGGFYGYYNGVWETTTTAPQKVDGPSWTLSETRLFDANNGALVWTGVVDTRENDNLGAALTGYVGMIFDAMVRDRVL
jgi:hypothetical protein